MNTGFRGEAVHGRWRCDWALPRQIHESFSNVAHTRCHQWQRTDGFGLTPVAPLPVMVLRANSEGVHCVRKQRGDLVRRHGAIGEKLNIILRAWLTTKHAA